ncbi:MAG: leucine--tRNA ligase [Spirochaetales bacterium]|nr:leucine--tRNA ligase [Spirochaetales bacterium]
MKKYDFRAIEKKWQGKWERDNTFKAAEDSSIPEDRRLYCLEMFPYPSGAGLHVGHLKNYVPTDTYCRFKHMQGFNVMHPMGWDAFGQPAENEAIKKGRNPRTMVPEYAENYKRTLKLAGCSYDWDREINSSLPEYYKWTQWFFLLLYKRGLAYRNNAPINWCPSCKTGLANEEVKEGRCWRCDAIVEKRPMPQWFFRITEYADRLLNDLDGLNWSDGMKEMQRNWIGRSEGAEVIFETGSPKVKIQVFTTRPDTLFGATFMVLAPEHPLAGTMTTPDRKKEVDEYIKDAGSKSEIERMNAERNKTGVFTGSFAVNPVNGKEIPVWIADYVLMGYGTGAIMAVPAHDTRDFEFAKKYDIPVIQVVSRDGTAYNLDQAEIAEGIAVNSGEYNGMTTTDFKKAVTKWLEEQGKGKYAVNYKLRDWLISRQRYWGAPIPIIHCPDCGEVPVPENELPVLLPEVDDYHPTGTGESPLAAISDFVNTSCPQCKGAAKRETDTMGGYACSSWYFFRFADPGNESSYASRAAIDYWLPVNLYAGGVEHARSHLLYSRFWTKVLYDEGCIGFQEPFSTLRNQGSLLAYTPGRKPRTTEKDRDNVQLIDWIVLKPEERDKYPRDQIVWRWARMSKSKGNVVTPDEIAEKYGADSLRIYEMFVAPFEDDVQWTEQGINGSHRFILRVWRWLQAALPAYVKDWKTRMPSRFQPSENGIRRKLHITIAKVGDDIEKFQFNTAISAIMELLNEIYSYAPIEKNSIRSGLNPVVVSEIIETAVLLMTPFTPHLGEELWHGLGFKTSVYNASWPAFDPETAAGDELTIVLQVNGKFRDTVNVPLNADEASIKSAALANPKAMAHVSGKKIMKVIVVPKKLVNIVVK